MKILFCCFTFYIALSSQAWGLPMNYSFKAEPLYYRDNLTATNIRGTIGFDKEILAVYNTNTSGYFNKSGYVEIFGDVKGVEKRSFYWLCCFDYWYSHETLKHAVYWFGATGNIGFINGLDNYNYENIIENINLTNWDMLTLSGWMQEDIDGGAFESSLHGTFKITELRIAPVPEPSTIILMVTGIIFLIFCKRKFKKI